MYYFTKLSLCTRTLSYINAYGYQGYVWLKRAKGYCSIVQYIFWHLCYLLHKLKSLFPIYIHIPRSWYSDVVEMAETQVARCIFRRLFSIYKFSDFFHLLSGFYHKTPVYSSHDQQSKLSSPYTTYTELFCWHRESRLFSWKLSVYIQALEFFFSKF